MVKKVIKRERSMENTKELIVLVHRLQKQLQKIDKEIQEQARFIQNISKYLLLKDPSFYLFTRLPLKIKKNKTLSSQEKKRLQGRKV